jgi:cytochrome c5
VGFAHEFTATDGPLVLSTTCLNCHADNSAQITATNVKYLTHSVSSDAFDISGGKQDQSARTSRRMMDTAEIATLGHLLGAAENADGTANPDEATERTGLCSTCHTNGTNQLGKVSCTTTWKQHLTNGMVTESVWEDITKTVAADLCGW